MKVQVLGTGCSRCRQLTANVEAALKEMGLSATVEKVEDVREMRKLHVMSTPALVVEGVVKSAGKVLAPGAVRQLLEAKA